MEWYFIVSVLAVTIPLSLLSPTPLDDLRINFNLNESPTGDEQEYTSDNGTDYNGEEQDVMNPKGAVREHRQEVALRKRRKERALPRQGGSPDPPPANLGQPCGGYNMQTCGPGLYCHYTDKNLQDQLIGYCRLLGTFFGTNDPAHEFFDKSTASLECPEAHKACVSMKCCSGCDAEDNSLPAMVPVLNQFQVDNTMCGLRQLFLSARRLFEAIQNCIKADDSPPRQVNILTCIKEQPIIPFQDLPCIRKVILTLEHLHAFGLEPENMNIEDLQDQLYLNVDHSVQSLQCHGPHDNALKTAQNLASLNVYKLMNGNCPWYQWPLCAGKVILTAKKCADNLDQASCIDGAKRSLGSCWSCVQKACCSLGLDFCCKATNVEYTKKFTMTYDLIVTGGDNNKESLGYSEIIKDGAVCISQQPRIPALDRKITGGQSIWIQETLIFCGGSHTFKAFTQPVLEWGASTQCFSLQAGDNHWSLTKLAGEDEDGQNNMNDERAWFSLTAIGHFENDPIEILAVGGINQQGVVLDTMEKYSIAKHRWTTLKTKLTNARFGHCAVSFHRAWGNQSYVIIVGGSNTVAGRDEWQPLNTVSKIDAETGEQTQLKNLPEPLWGPACTKDGGYLYVSGGSTGSKKVAEDKTYVYSFTGKVWSTLPGTLKEPRWGHVMGTIAHGQLVVAGGFNPDTDKFYKSVEKSNSDGQKWETVKQGLLDEREYLAMATVPSGTFSC